MTDTITITEIIDNSYLRGPGHDCYAYRRDLLCPDCGASTTRLLGVFHSSRYEIPYSDFLDSEQWPVPGFFTESDHEKYCAGCEKKLNVRVIIS